MLKRFFLRWLFVALLVTPAFANDWQYGIGASEITYPKGADDLWYEAAYPNYRTSHNFALNLDAEKQVSTHWSVKVGLLLPQNERTNSGIVADNVYEAGGCPAKCGNPGYLNTVTQTDGVYFLASPEYRGFFLDAGLWVFRQSVQAQAYTANCNCGVYPPNGYFNSIGYAIDPVYGVGYKAGRYSVSADWFITKTAAGNSFGRSIGNSSNHLLLPAPTGRLVVVTGRIYF